MLRSGFRLTYLKVSTVLASPLEARNRDGVRPLPVSNSCYTPAFSDTEEHTKRWDGGTEPGNREGALGGRLRPIPLLFLDVWF